MWFFCIYIALLLRGLAADFAENCVHAIAAWVCAATLACGRTSGAGPSMAIDSKFDKMAIS
jgi:hypothetical protein